MRRSDKETLKIIREGGMMDVFERLCNSEPKQIVKGLKFARTQSVYSESEFCAAVIDSIYYMALDASMGRIKAGYGGL